MNFFWHFITVIVNWRSEEELIFLHKGNFKCFLKLIKDPGDQKNGINLYNGYGLSLFKISDNEVLSSDVKMFIVEEHKRGARRKDVGKRFGVFASLV